MASPNVKTNALPLAWMPTKLVNVVIQSLAGAVTGGSVDSFLSGLAGLQQ